ncbi:hypothetical protein DLH72_04315 [Candidatus Gracilibacteria bacterium]|nr:MAG: hypothetical protein DLH72_04315 [Candidatus Gracilibacteria bacterium]
MRILINNDLENKNRFLYFLENYTEEQKMKIISSIEYVFYNHKGNPVPPFAKPLSGLGEDLFEFRISLGNILLRINYFIDKDRDYLVILNAYQKANGKTEKNFYNKQNKKKFDKLLNSILKNALDMKKEYFLNHNLSKYEFYN